MPAKSSHPRLRHPGFTPAEVVAFNGVLPPIHVMQPTSIRYRRRCPIKGCRRAIKKACPICGLARCARHAVQANKFDDCGRAGLDAWKRIRGRKPTSP